MTGIRLGTNIDSLVAQGELNQSTSALSKSFERLSSGLRINQASDDAAGLAVASELEGQTRIYTQAARNLNDGISALQMENSALDTLMKITLRQQELASEAANGTLGQPQRTALDNEAQALSAQYNQIISTTNFNGIQLLSAPTTVSIQAGIGPNETLQATLGGSLATLTTATATVSGGTDESALFSNFTLGEASQAIYFNNGSSFHTGDYFTLDTQGGPTVVWYNVDGAGGDPGLNDEVEIDISSGSTASDIAVATAYGLQTSASYGYGSIYNISAGGTAVDLNLDPIIGYQGLDNSVGTGFLDYGHSIEVAPTVGDATNFGYGAYLNISTPTQNYYVWTTVNDIGDDPGNGYGIQVNFWTGESSAQMASDVASAISSAAGASFTASANSGNLTVTSKAWGPPHSAWGNASTALSVSILSAGANPTGINLANNEFTAANHGFSTGQAVNVALNGGGTLPGPLSTSTTYYIIKVDNNNFKLASSAANAQNGIAIALTTLGSGYSSLTFTGGSVLSTNEQSFSLLSQSSAQTALTTLQNQSQIISNEQSSLGAFMSRFSFALSNVQERADQYTAAAAQIMDVDVASETANLVRTQILQQADSAILAQANQEPALVLKLLS